MSAIAIARPYASAVFAYADETNTLEQWQGALQQMAKFVSEYQHWVDSGQLVADSEVAAVITANLPELTAPQKNFLQVLVESKRVFYLPDIVARFEELLRQKNQVVEVCIETAMPIDDPAALEASIAHKVNKKIDITFVEKPALIGGVKIYVDDDVIDASIAGRLRQLEITLK